MTPSDGQERVLQQWITLTLGEKTGTSSQYANFNVSLFFPFVSVGFLLALIKQWGDFSDGPMVKTVLTRRGLWFNPWLGN